MEVTLAEYDHLSSLLGRFATLEHQARLRAEEMQGEGGYRWALWSVRADTWGNALAAVEKEVAALFKACDS